MPTVVFAKMAVVVAAVVAVASVANTLEVTHRRGAEGSESNEVAGMRFLQRYDVLASRLCNNFMEASWAFNTNVTDHNRRAMLARQLEWSEFHRLSYEEGRRYAWRGFSIPTVRRMFSFVTVLGRSALPDHDLVEYAELLQRMKSAYSTAKICRYKHTVYSTRGGDTNYLGGQGELAALDDDYDDVQTIANRTCLATLSLEPDLTRLMSTSRDPRQLRYVWRAWRAAAGAPLRPLYTRFVELANRAARLNGFADAGDYWRSDYEVGDLEADLDGLWRQLQPLYLHLHAYVRRRLRDHYGDHVPISGPIPAHLLGNMWAQDWSGTMNLTQPYPGRRPPYEEVSAEMRRQGYTPLRMFRIAENFYRSMGLEAVPLSFWQDSMFSKPRDREVVCHASAWDMCNRQDYRIKMCTDVTMEDLIKAHHEMGHIQYDLLYRNQSFIYRDGANPGFHEAVGDVIALSASSPKHLRALGLLPPPSQGTESSTRATQEVDINHLFGVAISKIAFLPFALVMDKWRWRVFSGSIPPSSMNAEWWKLRMAYSGVAPPVLRTEEDFDPGAKYHIPANMPYVRYLVSFVVQFQLHEELCLVSGHTGAPHTCSLYGATPAGDMLRRGLSLGRSQPWPTVLSELTGGRYSRLDPGPILRYFQPLHDWLEERNREEFIGWRPSEALVAGRTAGRSSRGAVAAYTIVAVLFFSLLLALACVIGRRWRRKHKAKEENNAAENSNPPLPR